MRLRDSIIMMGNPLKDSRRIGKWHDKPLISFLFNCSKHRLNQIYRIRECLPDNIVETNFFKVSFVVLHTPPASDEKNIWSPYLKELIQTPCPMNAILSSRSIYKFLKYWLGVLAIPNIFLTPRSPNNISRDGTPKPPHAGHCNSERARDFFLFN